MSRDIASEGPGGHSCFVSECYYQGFHWARVGGSPPPLPRRVIRFLTPRPRNTLQTVSSDHLHALVIFRNYKSFWGSSILTSPRILNVEYYQNDLDLPDWLLFAICQVTVFLVR